MRRSHLFDAIQALISDVVQIDPIIDVASKDRRPVFLAFTLLIERRFAVNLRLRRIEYELPIIRQFIMTDNRSDAARRLEAPDVHDIRQVLTVRPKKRAGSKQNDEDNQAAGTGSAFRLVVRR